MAGVLHLPCGTKECSRPEGHGSRGFYVVLSERGRATEKGAGVSCNTGFAKGGVEAKRCG